MSPRLAGKVVMITGATSGMGRAAAHRFAAEGASVVLVGRRPQSAAKHGVVGLTKSVALEWAARRVRVNALVTGNVDTPLYRRLVGMAADDPGELPAPNPAGRVASADEIAAFAAFLLGDDAAFITGAELPIDGGSTAQ